MIVRLQSSYGKIVALVLTLAFSLSFGWIIIQPWLLDNQINNLLAGKDFQKTPPIKSKNSNYYYLLGRYFQYSPLQRDFKEAKDSYVRAIFLSPVKAEYWIDLAKVEDALGNSADATRAVTRAVELKPAGLNVYWESANFWLKKGKIIKALKSFRYIVSSYPDERTRVYPLIWLATKGDLGVILKEAIPEEIDARLDYLWYLAGRGQKVESKKIWHFLPIINLPHSARLRYINQLISWRDIKDAKEEWESLKGVEVNQINLIWNGGFEELKTLNNGFDWSIGKAKGAKISIDNENVKNGKQSLRISFNGRENLDFSHVSQVVPLEPGEVYRLSVSMMTENITTTNGIKIEFFGLNGCKFYEATEVITGTNSWKELSLRAKPPKECSLAKVRIRRENSDKFNNLIAGTVWVDNVRLEKELSN